MSKLLFSFLLLGFVRQTHLRTKKVKSVDETLFLQTFFVSSQEELKPALKSLQEKLKIFKEVKQTCDKTAEHIKVK